MRPGRHLQANYPKPSQPATHTLIGTAPLTSPQPRSLFLPLHLTPPHRRRTPPTSPLTTAPKGGDLYTALRHHAETMRWERLGRKVALDVALGLNYLHSQVRVACGGGVNVYVCVWVWSCVY